MSKWIEFKVSERKPKTNVWDVLVKDGASTLGQVRWFGRWRCYAFYPEPDTVYEQQCLRDIADFCKDETKEHRAIVQEKKP